MGLFDKLFKRNKPEEPKKPEFTPVNDILKQAESEYAQKQREKEERIQRAIANTPGSEKYRLDKMQTESNAHILNITEFTPIAKQRFIVFDLETTGINVEESDIVEIGAVRVENGEITEEYQTLVCPNVKISADATAVNHITNDMVKGKPRIYEVLPSFLTFIGDDVLAAHNVRFDYGFLSNACMNSKFKVPERLFDTMALVKYYPEAGSKKLTALIDAAGIEKETAHRALSDARMTAKLILKTMEKREEAKKQSKKKVAIKDLDLSRCTEEVEIIDNSLAGLRFCITGGIPGYERADIERIIKQHNGKMTESISGKTDYLILGTYDLYEDGYISTKQKTALEIIGKGGKIQIINADRFFSLVNGNKEGN